MAGLIALGVACEASDANGPSLPWDAAQPSDATQQAASPGLAEGGLSFDAGRASDAAAADGRVQAASDAGASASDAGAVSDALGDASGGGNGAGAATQDAGMGEVDSPCPVEGPCVILPLGDSITYGLGVADNASYRVELFRKALAAQQAITFVGSVMSGPAMVDGQSFPRANEGHSGWTISQVAGLVPSPALEDKPNIVLLMAGTNDQYISPGPADAPARLGMLIDKLVAADPEMYIVVAQITPTSWFNDTIETFNAALPALVQERAMAGKHVFLVDLYTGFPSGALADGVHPTAEGYTWMAGVWYDAIKAWLR